MDERFLEQIIESNDENTRRNDEMQSAILDQQTQNGLIAEQQLETQDIIAKKQDEIIEAINGKDKIKVEIEGTEENELSRVFWNMLRGRKGEKGDANKLEIGEVISGDEALVEITGEAPNQVLNFVLPKGDDGKDGKDGKNGKNGKDGKNGKNGKDGKNGKNGTDGKDGKDGSPDTPKQVKEKLLRVGLKYNELKDLPDIKDISEDVALSVFRKYRQASKTVSLTELDDVDLGGLTKDANGKYLLGSGGGGGSMNDFTVAGDTGTNQTISDGDTLTFVGGIGIYTSASATDKITISLDSATQTSLGKADTALQNITGLIQQGSNVTITGNGTSGSPYVINSTASGGGGIALTDLSATTPVAYDNTTGVFSMAKATSSVDGYLDKTDWNIFNDKPSFSEVSILNNSILRYDGGSIKGSSVSINDSGQVYIHSGGLYINTGGITVDSGGFAVIGDSTIGGTLTTTKNMVINSGGTAFSIISRGVTSNYAGFQLQTAGSTKASIGLRPSSDAIYLFLDGASAANKEALTLIPNVENVFNNAGGAVDFRVEGDTDENAFFLKGSNDRVGIGTNSPTAKFDINSDIFRLRNAKTPSLSSDSGNMGDICWDSNYLYVCVTDNSWKRAALSTW